MRLRVVIIVEVVLGRGKHGEELGARVAVGGPKA